MQSTKRKMAVMGVCLVTGFLLGIPSGLNHAAAVPPKGPDAVSGDDGRKLAVSGSAPQSPSSVEPDRSQGLESKPSSEADHVPHKRDMAQEYAKQREALRIESLEQSLERLCDIRLFWMAPVRSEPSLIVAVPLPAGRGNHDVETILSNCRVLKLIEELGCLPEAQVSAMVTGALRVALPRYEKLAGDMKASLSQVPGGPKRWFRSLENNPDGSPRLAGARYEVLSLVLLAGHLRLADSRPAVLEVAAYAQKQREYCYGELASTIDLGYAICALDSDSLYSRPILVKGLTGTVRDQGLVSERFGPWEPKTRTVTTTSYEEALATPRPSMRTTTYDEARAKPGRPITQGIPPTPSKSMIEVQFLADIFDEEFDTVYDWARQVNQ